MRTTNDTLNSLTFPTQEGLSRPSRPGVVALVRAVLRKRRIRRERRQMVADLRAMNPRLLDDVLGLDRPALDMALSRKDSEDPIATLAALRRAGR